MAQYEDLIFDLRMHEKRLAFSGLGDSIECKLMKQSADAIEELSQIASHYEEESKGWWLAACEAKEKLADVQPVAHGRWKLGKNGNDFIGYPVYKCSVCGYWNEDVYGFLYCPNCGARMDGE